MSKKAEELSASLVRLARDYQDPKALLDAVRKEHPKASKKDIIHAALLSMIEQAEADEAAAQSLHRMAMDNRSDE